MEPLLPKIASPHDLVQLSEVQLEQLAKEMREALCHLVSNRTAHFASTWAWWSCAWRCIPFRFQPRPADWDTGHQIYPHKLVTGRYQDFQHIRTKGGLMGYPNPQESRLRLVHDRPCRLQCFDRTRPEKRRRTDWVTP